MKLFVGLLALIVALVISGLAGFISIIGMMALFPAGGIAVALMMGSLETGKLVAAGWLHANWENSRVSRWHKAYLTCATFVLMLITAMGIYGFLAKGHIEQEAPLATLELEIGQIEQRIEQTKQERERLNGRLVELDKSIAAFINATKTARDAQAALKARDAQKKEREQIATQLAAKDGELNKLSQSLVPLRLKTSDVSVKLGPIKYVASLFGWQDPNSAVQLVILMIMFAFDPLAVVLMLSATISIGEFFEARAKAKRARQAREVHALVPSPLPSLNPEPIVPSAPVADLKPRLDPEVLRVDTTPPIAVMHPLAPRPLVVEAPVEDQAEMISVSADPEPVITAATIPLLSDKDRLLDILEKNPALLNDIVETVREVQPIISEPADRAEFVTKTDEIEEKPLDKPKMDSDIDEKPANISGWLSEPWFKGR